jgi:hypothetical protein
MRDEDLKGILASTDSEAAESALPELDINIPPPPCKPPKQPDVFDEFTAGLEETPPDAIERLEVWLNDTPGREVIIGLESLGYEPRSGFDVVLRGKGSTSIGYDKELGLAATIHAVIDLAKERGI